MSALYFFFIEIRKRVSGYGRVQIPTPATNLMTLSTTTSEKADSGSSEHQVYDVVPPFESRWHLDS